MINRRMGRRVIGVEEADAAGGLYEARLRPQWGLGRPTLFAPLVCL